MPKWIWQDFVTELHIYEKKDMNIKKWYNIK